MTSPTAAAEKTGNEARSDERWRVGGLLLLLIAVSSLFYYKWGGSLRVLDATRADGKLALSPEVFLHGGLGAATLLYFKKIWMALCFGILIGAVVRAAVPASWITRWLASKGPKATVTGALAGAPLMLCSCCVTPIFTSVSERGARLGPSLALMLASPGLNLAALTLTFALMPLRFGIVRLVGALIVVLGVSTIVGRMSENRGERAEPRRVAREETDEPMTARLFAKRFFKSLGYMIVVTVPLIVIGVVASGLLLPLLPALGTRGVGVAIAVTALFGVLVALPTFFEIPLALVLLQLGAPPGVAVALLVAGPIVNLPSLFVLARETTWRTALALGIGVWGVATLSGLAATV